MANYDVSNVKSSHCFGIYEADSPEGAIAACLKDAGYEENATDENGTPWAAELIAVAVRPIGATAKDAINWLQDALGSGAPEDENFAEDLFEVMRDDGRVWNTGSMYGFVIRADVDVAAAAAELL